jgi:prefoldin subunit 5
METKELVAKAVERVNSSAVRKVEDRVQNLVDTILNCEAEIVRLHERIVECKKELRALNVPSPVSVEI